MNLNDDVQKIPTINNVFWVAIINGPSSSCSRPAIQQPAMDYIYIFIFPLRTNPPYAAADPVAVASLNGTVRDHFHSHFLTRNHFPGPSLRRRRLQMTTQKRTPRPSRSNKLCRPLPFVHWDWQLNRVGAALISRARLPSFIVIPLSTLPPSTVHHADRCRSVSLPFKTLGGGWWWWW